VRALTLSILTYSLFTGCCFFAMAPWHLGALRFLAGWAWAVSGRWAWRWSWNAGRTTSPLLAAPSGGSNLGFGLIALLGAVFSVTRESWRGSCSPGSPRRAEPVYHPLCARIGRWRQSVRAVKAHPLRELAAPGLRRATLLAIAFAAIALIGTWARCNGCRCGRIN